MEYFQVLWSYLLVSAPYLIFGLLVSGAIHQYISVDQVKKLLGGNRFSAVFKAAAVGVPLPLCSCSVIPTAVTLRKSGASNASTSAFLISTPESGVDSISITYALMDLPMTIIRPVAAFASALIAGCLQFVFNDFTLAENEQTQVKSCCPSKKKKEQGKTAKKKFFGMFDYAFGKLSDDIATWLAIGILMGAMVEFVVPDDFFTNLGVMQNRIAILTIGIPLYICASASTPIAVSLMLKGLSPGSAIILLLVGPATNISNIAVLQKYIGKKGVIINILTIALVALGFSFIVDYLYANFVTLKLSEALQNHEHGHVWWETLSAVFLVYLLLKGIWKEKIAPKLSAKDSHCH